MNLLEEPTEYDLIEILQIWSCNSLRKINYQDFLRWVLPFNKFPRPIDDNFSQVNIDVKYSVKRLFEKEIEFLRKAENYKEMLKENVGNGFSRVFDSIAGGKKNLISKEDLFNYLNSNGVKVSEQGIDGIFRRIDKDNDGLLSLSDFVDFFNTNKPYATLRSSKSKEDMPIRNERIEDLRENSQRLLKGVNKVQSSSLTNLFQGLIYQEKTLEGNRNELALRLDFTVQLLFQYFDRKRRKVISEVEFDKGLKVLGIKISSNDIFLIFRHYDKNTDGMLDLSDFSDIFLPKRPEYAALITSRDPKPQLSIETTKMIVSTFLLIIELENHAEYLRRALSLSRMTLQEAFQCIKKANSQYFTINEFREILQSNNIFPTIRDLRGLVERFDTDRDGRITFSEFVQGILPKSPNLNQFN